MNVLIAEDDTVSREMLAQLLNKFGHEVEQFSDGESALNRLLEPDAPHVVVLDRVMPGMDGLEVIRWIRENVEIQPYILVLSSKGEMVDKVAGLQAGADDYLIKPIDPAELRARMGVGERILEIQTQLNHKVHELQKALQEIHTLRGILPICSYCKKIRDDQGYWEQVEVYVHRNTNANFSHSICPDCLTKYFPDMEDSFAS